MNMYVCKNTGRIRFFMDSLAAGIVRDVDGEIAILLTFGPSYYIDIITGEMYYSR